MCHYDSDDDADTNFEWQLGGRVAVMGVRRRRRGRVGASAAAKKTSCTPEKRDGGQKNGACGAGNAAKKRGRGFLGGPRAKHSVWGEGEPYCTMINDGMEAHRDEHTHSIQPRLQQGAVEMRRSCGGRDDIYIMMQCLFVCHEK